VDIAEILKKAKPPERVVELCLDADLAAEHDDLNRQLSESHRTGAATMAAAGEAATLARRIRDLEDRMQASVVTFRMRGLSAFRYQEWLEANPGRDGKQERFNPVTAVVPLIAACCVDPAMTVDEAQQLVDVLGTGQTDRLFGAALEATEGAGAVPFSVAASATLRATEQRQ
jgi:hypothetical protein